MLLRLIEEAGNADLSHFMPALRCVGNILTTSDPAIIERCLLLGVVDKLTSILYQSNSQLIKEALWGFSNITAGPGSHIEAFINNSAFDRVVMLTASKNIDIRKESLYVICNSITGSDVINRSKIFEATNG